MQSALIVDAVLLAVVLGSDLGPHRKIGRMRIIRPLVVAAAIVPLFLKPVVTKGHGLSLEIAATGFGLLLGLVAVALMTVYRSSGTGKPVSRAGFSYGLLWTLVIGARAAFSYGSEHWFSHPLATWMTRHSVSTAAITDALIFMAVAMLVTRTLGIRLRASRAPSTSHAQVSPAW
jgi:hypothetical protein